MRFLQDTARLILALWLAIAPAYAGSLTLLGAGKAPSGVVGYQGPGDVVSGAVVGGSCARAYNAAYANGTNPLCDLKDVATGTVSICTLRVKTNGFVDLTGTYCVGSTTPAAACAAAAGTACVITKIYDQTGNGNHLTQATLANMPLLAFSTLNSLPSIRNANTTSILTTPSMTIATPLTMLTVAQRTASFTNTARLITPTTLATPRFSFNSVANQVAFNAGAGNQIASASDSAFHAFQIVEPSAGNSTIVVDGATTSVAAGNTSISAITMSILNDNSFGSPLSGDMMEFWIYPSGFNATQYGNMNTNIHSLTNGYNF